MFWFGKTLLHLFPELSIFFLSSFLVGWHKFWAQLLNCDYSFMAYFGCLEYGNLIIFALKCLSFLGVWKWDNKEYICMYNRWGLRQLTLPESISVEPMQMHSVCFLNLFCRLDSHNEDPNNLETIKWSRMFSVSYNCYNIS